MSRLVLAVLGGGVLAAAIRWPVVAGVLLVFAAVTAGGGRRYHRWASALAASRVGEDIGTFAREFDRRAPGFDPHVARAVWDALRAELAAGGPPVPIRPTDHLTRDLRLDPEDVALDLLAEVAARTGRDLESAPRRSPPARVETVADLVAFVAALPRRATG
jgi:hypothetical protein